MRSRIAALCSLLIAVILSTSCSAAVVQIPLSSPSATTENHEFLPVVIWHGLGDTYDSEGLQSVGDILNETNPGTFTYYIRIDDDANADRTASFLGNVTLQIEKVCKDLASHPILSNASAINAIGFSQGGQFLRGYVERCNNPPVANFITFGSPHNGISEFQKCAPNDWLCYTWDGFLKARTWVPFVQSRLIPAQYFRDPEDLEGYLEHSNFLADVNNERTVKNSRYRENIKKLEKFVMYMFSEDTTVVPKESTWFREVNATTGQVTKLQDRQLYKDDWLGLRFLDERNRLEFLVAEGQHMQITEDILIDVFSRYFKPVSKKSVRKD